MFTPMCRLQHLPISSSYLVMQCLNIALYKARTRKNTAMRIKFHARRVNPTSDVHTLTHTQHPTGAPAGQQTTRRNNYTTYTNTYVWAQRIYYICVEMGCEKWVYACMFGDIVVVGPSPSVAHVRARAHTAHTALAHAVEVENMLHALHSLATAAAVRTTHETNKCSTLPARACTKRAWCVLMFNRLVGGGRRAHACLMCDMLLRDRARVVR